MVDLRKYLVEADLSSFDRYRDGIRQRNIPANHYDAAISIFEMQKSLRDWQF